MVPANKPLIAAFATGGGAYSCWPKPILFTPEPGHDYELQLEMLKISTFKSGCVIRARKLSNVGTTTVERPVLPDLCVKGVDGTFRTVGLQEQLEKIRQNAKSAN